MKCIFKNKRISSIVAVAPRQEFRFDDEYPFYKMTESQAKRFKKMMSLDRHRIACMYGGAILLSARGERNRALAGHHVIELRKSSIGMGADRGSGRENNVIHE